MIGLLALRLLINEDKKKKKPQEYHSISCSIISIIDKSFNAEITSLIVEGNINSFLFWCNIKELKFISHAAEGISS